jgi:hypothetical protein
MVMDEITSKSEPLRRFCVNSPTDTRWTTLPSIPAQAQAQARGNDGATLASLHEANPVLSHSVLAPRMQPAHANGALPPRQQALQLLPCSRLSSMVSFESTIFPSGRSSNLSGSRTPELIPVSSEAEAKTAVSEGASQAIRHTGALRTTLQTLKHGSFLAGAHLMRQVVGTGVPYFARELAAYGIYQLLKNRSGISVGLQTGLVFAGIAAQVIRMTQDQRHPIEAARATTGVSQQEWTAMSPENQQHHIRAHQAMSAVQTVMQVAGSSINLAMSVEGYIRIKPAQSAMALATELKSMVFCVLRDTSQASFSMVSANQAIPEILCPAFMVVAAVVYGSAQGLLSLAGDALRTKSTFSTKSVFDVEKKSGFSAFVSVMATSGVKAATNTLIESIDDSTQATLKACKWGARQRVDPQFNYPPPDRARLLDQTPARHAFVNLFLAGLNLVDTRLGACRASDKTRVLVGNSAAIAFGAVLYPSTVSLWQGSAAVREHVRRSSDTSGSGE